MQDYEIAARDLAAMIADLGLAVSCQFVPFSASRNAKEASPSLNWRCTVTRNDKPVQGLESVDYMQGSGHCPASKARKTESDSFWPLRFDQLQRKAVASECETGRAHRIANGHTIAGKALSPPTATNIIAALCCDAGVLDYAVFEDWAADLGMDPDSRKGEAMYRACLASALALRAAVGDEKLGALRDLANQL